MALADAASQQSYSPGWITIQEYGIRFSFDITKLMYSRGNVTEKVRFARECVQDQDVVLDMYAGIGYYTLPALILGKAKHVHACEWNVNAVNALRFNVVDNGLSLVQPEEDKEEVADGVECTRQRQQYQTAQKVGRKKPGGKVTIYHGDSRNLLKQFKQLKNAVDRVSLGLLPSSEGGWKTAVEALRLDQGGWLHVHGNVPTLERKQWALWLCARLVNYCRALPNKSQWTAVCHQVTQVKSFAPRIDHVVADVFVGPTTDKERWKSWFSNCTGIEDDEDYNTEMDLFIAKMRCGAARCSKNDPFDYVSSGVVKSPSCALSPDGVLHQAWMMPK